MMSLLRKEHRHSQEEIEALLDKGIFHLEQAANELKEYAEHVRRDKEEHKHAERSVSERADGTGPRPD